MDANLIPLTGTSFIEFTPTELREADGPRPVFSIRIPTFAMRDKMAAILFQRKFIPATLMQSRGILVNALYDLYDEDTADQHASFLEAYWTQEEVHNEVGQAWQIQEAQRLFDLGAGVRQALPQQPIPPAPYTMREQARHASIISNALHNDDSFRNYQARFMVAQEEEREMLVRLFLFKWEGCGDVVAVRDSLDRLTKESIEEVRTWLAEQGAKIAWDEVKKTVMQQFGGSGVLEKNLDSPLDTNSSPTGSQTMSGDLAINDGISTTSATTPTPAGKLRTPSGGSRNSRSSSSAKKKVAGKNSGLTV